MKNERPFGKINNFIWLYTIFSLKGAKIFKFIFVFSYKSGPVSISNRLSGFVAVTGKVKTGLTDAQHQ